MDGKQANSFLVQKRNWCSYVQEYSEMIREGKTGTFGSSVNVWEECCDEGCDTEEMDENTHPFGHSNRWVVRINIYDYALSYTLLSQFTHYPR